MEQVVGLTVLMVVVKDINEDETNEPDTPTKLAPCPAKLLLGTDHILKINLPVCTAATFFWAKDIVRFHLPVTNSPSNGPIIQQFPDPLPIIF